ncbi:GNAT family N-acetyltransferase [Micromonospora inaquosa]|uniref:GNAT family N-acetyltransferase n=1 Tax=Micromonospora inaquosa TaxID=2203716 RepID=A0A3N9W965_9ACTN|nr:GNAT family N-acetyltransferase [Micromonospora inaquosa]RQW97364.1 GNAT family N-acetyltransferase [Micromonospora inaquosa]
MLSPVTLRPILPDDLPLVERLWQLYRHDLSEFRGTLPDESGSFTLGRLPTYLQDPDSSGYIICQDTRPVGFAFVSSLEIQPLRIAEFFVVRAVRRSGVGSLAARQLFARHTGHWEVPFQEENPGAARFWRRLAAEVCPTGYHEEQRAVPGKPHIPPDTWLLLTEPMRTVGTSPVCRNL